MQVGREGIEPLVSHPTIEDSGFTDHRGEHNPFLIQKATLCMEIKRPHNQGAAYIECLE